MKKRFILIDSENVQNRLFEIIENARKKDKIIVFYTVYHSGKLEEYLKNEKKKGNIEFVECIAGNNALDLQLMGVLSYLIHRHPKREFIVYSNDKGYKSLVKHWTSRNVDIELINFITPTVGEEAYAFKSPITVELPGKRTARRKKSEISSDGKRKILTPKKKNTTAAEPEKSRIKSDPQKKADKSPAAPAQLSKKPEDKKVPENSTVKQPQKNTPEHRPERQPKDVQPPAAVQTPKKPAAVVDALIFPKKAVAPKSEKPQNIVKPEPVNKPAVSEETTAPAAVAEEKAIQAAGTESPIEATAVGIAEKEEPKPHNRRSKKQKTQPRNENIASDASEQTAEEADITPEISEPVVIRLTSEDFIREMCKSVRSTDLALINRVLTIGFGSEGSKEYYSKFKSDPGFREEMGKYYLYAKQDRVISLIRTALAFNELDTSAAGEICAILKEKGLGNMQSVYHSFIKRMPGKVGERQMIYQTIKPYLAVLDNL